MNILQYTIEILFCLCTEEYMPVYEEYLFMGASKCLKVVVNMLKPTTCIVGK